MANNNQVNQTVENDDMVYASMAALQQQEELEKDAYNRGDMNAAYSADTYQNAINPQIYEIEQSPTAIMFGNSSENTSDNSVTNDVSSDVTKEKIPLYEIKQNPTAMALENSSENTSDNSVINDVSSDVTKDATQEKKYNNVFASMFHKVANVFGTDSAIGSKFEEVANQLEDRYGTDAHEVQQEAMGARLQRGNDGIKSADVSNVKTTAAESETQGAKSKSEDYIPTAEKQSSREEQLKVSNEHMKESADLAVSDDDFLSMKDAKDSKFQVMTSSMNVMGRELQMDSAVRLTPDDATAEDYSDVANNYMTMARGVKAYNDEALKGINEKYKDDPEKLETAKAGLSNLMTHASENMYGIIGDSNKMNNFLSEADKKELDNMHLQGVTTTYSDYVKEHQLEPERNTGVDKAVDKMDDKESDKTDNKTNGYTLTGTSGVTSRVAQRETATKARKNDLNTANRGQMAEDKFKHILDKTNAPESSYDMDMGK